MRPAGPASAVADQVFGADLLRALDAGTGNSVFSPASVATVLRMALLGARGETAAQMAAVLHLSGPAQACREEAVRALALRSDTLAALDGGPEVLRAPATMWVQSGLPLRPGFRERLAGLAVGAHDADFRHAPEAARRAVNAVISEQTAGKIEDLLPPGSVDAATRLVLADSVYLKAAWARPFPAGATGDGPFRTAAGPVASVPMMRLTASLDHLQGDGYQAVVLPYEGGRLAMVILLPDGPVAPLAGRLADGGLAGLARGAAPERMRLVMPRFRLRARSDLGGVLRGLGMEAAFGPGADFRGVTTAGRLAVGAVAHMAFVDVDERGTEAAAATGLTMIAMSAAAPPRLEVRVDHPFLFAIMDVRNGLPLFLGAVADPSAGPG